MDRRKSVAEKGGCSEQMQGELKARPALTLWSSPTSIALRAWLMAIHTGCRISQLAWEGGGIDASFVRTPGAYSLASG